jgi:hypothetical protein
MGREGFNITKAKRTAQQERENKTKQKKSSMIPVRPPTREKDAKTAAQRPHTASFFAISRHVMGPGKKRSGRENDKKKEKHIATLRDYLP